MMLSHDMAILPIAEDLQDLQAALKLLDVSSSVPLWQNLYSGCFMMLR